MVRVTQGGVVDVLADGTNPALHGLLLYLVSYPADALNRAAIDGLLDVFFQSAGRVVAFRFSIGIEAEDSWTG